MLTITHTFSGDGCQGRVVTDTASQAGNQININFTNGCNISTGRLGVADNQTPAFTPQLVLSIRPNPNNGHFEVVLGVPASQPYTLGLTDLAGRVMATQAGIGGVMANRSANGF